MEEFIDYLKVNRRYSPRTQILYREYIGELYEFVAPDSGEDFLSSLKPNIIRGFIAQGLDSGLSPRTMNLKLSAISSYCSYLMRKELIDSNPVKKVYRPKQSKNFLSFTFRVQWKTTLKENLTTMTF